MNPSDSFLDAAGCIVGWAMKTAGITDAVRTDTRAELGRKGAASRAW